MNSIISYVKFFLSLIVSCFVSIVGGVDELFSFLAALVIADIITGILCAIKNKEVSSKKMKDGALSKVCIIVIIGIAVAGDKLLNSIGVDIVFGDTQVYIRTITILYFAFEELISILENIGNTNIVPLPKWLISILKQVNSTINGNSTPKAVIAFIKKVFNIDIEGIDKKSKDNDDIDKTNEDEK